MSESDIRIDIDALEPRLSPENTREVEETFQRYTKRSRDGTLFTGDLMKALMALGQNQASKEKWLLSRVRHSNIGVTLDEFVKIMTKLVNDTERSAEMQSTFSPLTKKQEKRITNMTLNKLPRNKRPEAEARKKVVVTERKSCCIIS
eukprot:snap_masked-scaffold_6-processed-gene-20.19-mRNA-1 protein AED:1.00 eAED:1.00 QI:0/-1/0/0/-1/1/1/0/146